jgi:hypothetical protein
VYVTIDPGLTTGWAIWTQSGLVACGLDDPRSSPHHLVVVPADDDRETIGDVWIEDPVIYPRSKARPADIMALKGNAYRWAGRYDVFGVYVHFVEPAQWKGQTPKDIHHSRIWARLTLDEREVVNEAARGMAPSKRHNMLDAVGLGLWVANRSRA